MLRYATLTCARNEQKTIGVTLDSIMNQTVPPKYIIVVDDGSTDKTSEIIMKAKRSLENKAFSEIILKKRKNRGFDALGSGLMADVYNTGARTLLEKEDWDYLLIIGADTVIPRHYVETIIDRMNEGNYGVAGGMVLGKHPLLIINDTFCFGTGRIIRRELIDAVNGFVRCYLWESTPFILSEMSGYNTGHFKDVIFKTRVVEKRGNKYTIGMGRGMKEVGTPLVHLLARCFSYIVKRRMPMGAFYIFVGYMTHSKLKKYKTIVDWQNNFLKYRLKIKMIRIIDKVLRLG